MGWKSRGIARLVLIAMAGAGLSAGLSAGLAPGMAQPAPDGTPRAPLSGAPPAASPPGGATPAPLSGPAWIAAETADLALLDKVTARTRMVSLAVGGRTEFGTLTIAVSRCMRRPPEEPAEAAAWITVADSRAGQGAAPVFGGWMFATSPALNPLQHPVYDVRVLACK